LVIPSNKIPENTTFPGHYADPALFKWDSEWINRWDLLGFPEYKGKYLERNKVPKQSKLPQVCEIINLTEDELITLWLKPENFRMIDMNLRGNLREPALRNKLTQLGCKVNKPIGKYPKYDLLVNGYKVQIKGFSKGLANISENTFGVEVMGTHGYGEIRRYSETDFDFLAVVIEPSYLNDSFKIDRSDYHFFLVPSKDLPLHYKNEFEWKTNDKLYDVARFKLSINNEKIEVIPNNTYSKPTPYNLNGTLLSRNAVSLRNSNIYTLDDISLLKK
jgi:hypothetical protein